MVIFGGATSLNLASNTPLSMWIAFPVFILSCTHVLIGVHVAIQLVYHVPIYSWNG
jgi:hypothetical protein